MQELVRNEDIATALMLLHQLKETHMNIRTPQPAQAARLLQQFFKAQGLEVKYSQALEAVARMNGYQDLHAMQADTRFVDPLVISAISSNEFELREKDHNVWIGVDGISVCVTRNDEGVSVDLYAKGHEDNSLQGTYLHFAEAEDAAEETEEEARGTSEFTEKASPHVLDGPGVWGVRGNPDDFPCGEIEIAPAQPCVLTAPSEDEFSMTPVDWTRVAAKQGIKHAIIDGKAGGVITAFDADAMRKLAHHKDLSVHLRLAQTPALVVFTAYRGAFQEIVITLGQLQKAVEYTPGVIDLIDGRRLEFLVFDEKGEMRHFSPATNGDLVRSEPLLESLVQSLK